MCWDYNSSCSQLAKGGIAFRNWAVLRSTTIALLLATGLHLSRGREAGDTCKSTHSATVFHNTYKIKEVEKQGWGRGYWPPYFGLRVGFGDLLLMISQCWLTWNLLLLFHRRWTIFCLVLSNQKIMLSLLRAKV